MSKILLRLNDNVLEILGLRNEITDAYINDATVTVTLTETDGTEIVGQSWPLSLPYVAGSNGNYRVTLKDTLTLTDIDEVIATIDADGGADLKFHADDKFRVLDRQVVS
jgi:hypothetical protein